MDGEPERTDREHGSVRSQRYSRARRRAGDAGASSGRTAGDRRCRQGIRHAGFRSGMPEPERDAARGAEHETAWGSAMDGRTTRHGGYEVSQKKRKRIEECFGWLKTIAMIRKVRHRGLENVGWVFTLAAAAYNLVRMRKLTARPLGVV